MFRKSCGMIARLIISSFLLATRTSFCRSQRTRMQVTASSMMLLRGKVRAPPELLLNRSNVYCRTGYRDAPKRRARCRQDLNCRVRWAFPYLFPVINSLNWHGLTHILNIVAEHMRVPLYSMSAAQLGIDSAEVEQSLSDILEMTTKWKAILLLDETEVFLEQRTIDGLERNKLVSSMSHYSLDLEWYELTACSLPTHARILPWRALPDYQSRCGA